MSTSSENADWMWEIMKEAREELKKRPSWDIELLRNAPRMYPSISDELKKEKVMVKPLSPQEFKVQLPDEVIESFNELIRENFKIKSAKVYQDDVIERILNKFNDSVSRQQIFDNCWLDVEGVFGEVGWDVVYDKPAYYETYLACFIFTKK